MQRLFVYFSVLVPLWHCLCFFILDKELKTRIFNRMEKVKIYSISEITAAVKELVEALPGVWIEGEISNYREASSGHLYFDMKDEAALIACIIWREKRGIETVGMKDGMKIKAFGNLRVYAKGGRYNFNIEQVYPVGVGELQIRFNQLKAKLEKEGLFDSEYKKELPEFPERIGIVSSIGGAAIHDIIRILNKRRPFGIEIIVRDTRVQGEDAPEDIAEGIQEFNEYGVDLIIISRGGGSVEDLWAFNEEVVARAIYASEIPIVSAVGHEIDYTIADYVADVRAPTPSGAAELIVRDSKEILEDIENYQEILLGGLEKLIKDYREILSNIAKSYGIRRIADLIKEKWQTIDDLTYKFQHSLMQPVVLYKGKIELLEEKMNQNTKQAITKEKHSIREIAGRLEAVNPKATLKRGYSIVRKLPGEEIIKSSKKIASGDKIRIELSEGKAKCEVEESE